MVGILHFLYLTARWNILNPPHTSYSHPRWIWVLLSLIWYCFEASDCVLGTTVLKIRLSAETALDIRWRCFCLEHIRAMTMHCINLLTYVNIWNTRKKTNVKTWANYDINETLILPPFTTSDKETELVTSLEPTLGCRQVMRWNLVWLWCRLHLGPVLASVTVAVLCQAC